MRLSFVLLTIVATLLASSEARLLRQGISTKTAGLTSENNAESEERRFIVRSVLSGAITKAESAPLKTSKWDSPQQVGQDYPSGHERLQIGVQEWSVEVRKLFLTCLLEACTCHYALDRRQNRCISAFNGRSVQRTTAGVLNAHILRIISESIRA
ncbi:hypothetical protein PC128_g14611 [Phytophthora cactorum]|nr:hypothetical protein PC128_g14611 [Phytophthora cactorum]